MSGTSRKSRSSQNGAATNGVAHVSSPEQNRNGSSRTKWPSQHSRRERSARLQDVPSADAVVLDVTYGSGVTLSLTVGGQQILDGAWEGSVTVDGHYLALAGKWELNLWHADADCDYLEVTCLVDEKLRVDRQILVSRTDRFVLVSDAVMHAEARKLEYVSRLSLAKKITGQRPGKTREIRLGQGRKSVARVFPAGLPQDVVQGKAGSLSSQNGNLELHQFVDGRALFAPLVIDLHPDRRSEPADWRSLTVTEEEKIVQPDRASGYRLRIGPCQLLLYRSLQATVDSRCLLGFHTRFETAIGKVQPIGGIRQIMATIPDD